MGLITDDFNRNGGGAERWIAAFASHLVRSGHEVHVLAFQARGAVPGPVPHVLTDPGTPLARARAVEALVSTLSPMVLYDGGTSWSGHVSHPHTGSALLSLDREIASHVPWRRLRAALSPRLNARRHEMARVEQRAAASASRIIALSARLRVLLSTRHALPAERLTVIPNGVDTTRFSPDRLAPSRAAARAELGAGEALLCLMVAHNLRLKGFDTALRAIAPLVARGADIRLIVAGGMPDRAWAGLTAAMGLAGRVVFTGDVPDIERLYAAADILVHPTRWDACSLATIEAMACGLPVVTTAMNGAADLITHGRDGHVVADPEDHAALARCIAALSDPATRRRIGAAAREAAVQADIGVNHRAVEAVLAAVARERQDRERQNVRP